MNYLAGLHFTGVRGLFHVDLLDASQQHLLLAHKRERSENPAPPSPHTKEVSCLGILLVFLTLLRQNCYMACIPLHSPPPFHMVSDLFTESHMTYCIWPLHTTSAFQNINQSR